jgi:hypothetical protein
MPSQADVARFIARVALAMNKDGESAHERFFEEQPLLYLFAAAQLQEIWDGPEKQREEFVTGLHRILDRGYISS